MIKWPVTYITNLPRDLFFKVQAVCLLDGFGSPPPVKYGNKLSSRITRFFTVYILQLIEEEVVMPLRMPSEIGILVKEY